MTRARSVVSSRAPLSSIIAVWSLLSIALTWIEMASSSLLAQIAQQALGFLVRAEMSDAMLLPIISRAVETSWPRSRNWSSSVMPPWLRSLASDDVRFSMASASVLPRPSSASVSAWMRPSMTELSSTVRFSKAPEMVLGAVLERDVEAAGAVVERGEQVAGALVDQRHEDLGALAERAVERVAGGFERLGQVAARFDDRAGDALADHVEIEHEAGVALGDRFADAFGVGDDGFALAGQFLDQGAHARFIVGIGAFERGDLVVDHHFEFAGAREGALEAIAERVDFAANGLADRGDLFGRGGFGFGETDRGVRHGGRGVAQVLRTADQRGDGKEGEDRDDGERDEPDEIVGAPECRRAELAAVADQGDRRGSRRPRRSRR